MNKEAKVQILMLYYENGKSVAVAIRKFCTMHKIKNNYKRPKESSVRKIISKFKKYGMVNDLPRSGRGDAVCDEDIEAVREACDRLQSLGDLPTTKNIGQETGRSSGCVWNIMKKKLGWTAYKIQTTQLITDVNKQKRLTFANRFLQQFSGDALSNVVFSDESYFSVSGVVNRQNTRFWGEERPSDATCEVKRYDEKIMVWAAFSKSLKLPIVLLPNGTLNQNGYIEMLENEVVPFLKSKRKWRNTVFQQDGARPHTSDFSLRALMRLFPGGIISDRTDFFWPPNSPDLSPLDFFLWGWMKNRVYSPPRPRNLAELRAKIRIVYEELSMDTIQNCIDNVTKRLEACKDANGGHLENIIE